MSRTLGSSDRDATPVGTTHLRQLLGSGQDLEAACSRAHIGSSAPVREWLRIALGHMSPCSAMILSVPAT